MAGLRFETRETWMVPNWLFERFIERVIRDNEHDHDLVQVLRTGIYHNGLHLDLLRARGGDLADRALIAIENSAKEILRTGESGVPEGDADSEGKRMFHDAIASLVGQLKTSKS